MPKHRTKRALPKEAFLALGVIRTKRYKCADCNCIYKHERDRTVHVNESHLELRKFECPEPHCASKPFSRERERDKHVREVHLNLRPWPCSVCDLRFKRKYDRKKHEQTHDRKHDHLCPQCNMPFTRPHDLKRHLVTEHQPNYCSGCKSFIAGKKMTHTEKDGTMVLLCSACYHDKTGKEVRVELQWREYLNEYLGTEHLLLCDQPMKRFGGDSNFKPDRLSRYGDRALLEECDEHQHEDTHRYKDEEGRMLAIMNDPMLAGTTLIVIRWNPHAYTPPEGQQRKGRATRLETHVALVRHLLVHPPTARITVYYLFYSADNPQICRNLPHHLLYSVDDVAALSV